MHKIRFLVIFRFPKMRFFWISENIFLSQCLQFWKSKEEKNKSEAEANKHLDELNAIKKCREKILSKVVNLVVLVNLLINHSKPLFHLVTFPI